MNTILSFTASAFRLLLNISIRAGWIVLVIAGLRCILKKTPRAAFCAMWSIAGLGLLPIRIESIFSLVPSKETFPAEIISSGIEVLPSAEQAPAINIINNPLYSAPVSIELSENPAKISSAFEFLGAIWLAGMAIMLCYMLISTLKLKKQVATAVPVSSGILQSENVSMPFLLGIFRPVIYLPCGLNETDKKFIVAHEQAHIDRKDYLWKPLGFLLLSIYWFNPVIWLAYILLCRDIEAACDERVVRNFSIENKQNYSRTLLSCSINRRNIAACPLAFGEGDVKERVQNVMSYKKPAFWIIILSVVICIVLALCFLTSPKTTNTAADFDIKRDRTTQAKYAVIADPDLPKFSVKIAWDGFEHDQIEVLKNGKTVASFNTDGVVQKAFFYDITADGKPDLIFNTEKALGQISKTISVFDISDPDNIKQYNLEDRYANDFVLDKEQNIPTVNILPKKSSELYASGKLVLKQGKLFVNNGLQFFSGSEVADKDALLAKYAKAAEFDMSNTGDQSTKKNDPWFIIPDYFNSMLKALSSDVSHKYTRQMIVNSIKYLEADELEQDNNMFLLSSIEDAVITSEAEPFAAFEVNYHLSDISDNPETNSGAQYPSGDYIAIYILGKTEKSDRWQVIRFAAPIGTNNN